MANLVGSSLVAYFASVVGDIRSLHVCVRACECNYSNIEKLKILKILSVITNKVEFAYFFHSMKLIKQKI